MKSSNEKIVAIQNLDLANIAWKLQQSTSDGAQAWSEKQTEKAVEEYRKFLMLCIIYPEKSIVPTVEADEVWHMHILDTVKYHEDCNSIFGKYIHHIPAYQEVFENEYSETQILYAEAFKVDLSGTYMRCSRCKRDGECHRN